MEPFNLTRGSGNVFSNFRMEPSQLHGGFSCVLKYVNMYLYMKYYQTEKIVAAEDGLLQQPW